MARYALVAPDDSIHTEKDETRIDFDAGLRDGYRWLRIDNITNDTTTQDRWITTEPMVEAVLADRVARTRTRRDMTAAEIDAAKASRSASLVDDVQWKAIFILLNEIRGLNGQQAVSVAQFRNWIEGQM